MIPAVDLSGFELNSIENSRFLAAKGIPGAVRFAIWHAPKLYLDFGMTSSATVTAAHPGIVAYHASHSIIVS
jgi:hypothetical protein